VNYGPMRGTHTKVPY